MAATKNRVIKLNNSETVQFLALYAGERVLYDADVEDYRDQNARIAAAQRISDALNIPGFGPKAILAKFTNLRSHYCQELKKIADSERTEGIGCGGDVYKPKVFWFDQMNSFIRPFVQQRWKRLNRGASTKEKTSHPSPEKKLHQMSDSARIESFMRRLQQSDIKESDSVSESSFQGGHPYPSPIGKADAIGFKAPPSSAVKTIELSEDDESMGSLTEKELSESDSDHVRDIDYDGNVFGYSDNKMDITDAFNSQNFPSEENRPRYTTPTECDNFGEYIAEHLQRLPLDVALKLQSEIQTLVIRTRLEYVGEHPPEAPAMVEQDVLSDEEEEPPKPLNTKTPNLDNQVQRRMEKRTQNTKQPGAKRFRFDGGGNASNDSTNQPSQNRRTECTVFAENITVQLEQLPVEVSHRLQADIYALIRQAYPKNNIEEDPPDCVKIESEEVCQIIGNC